MSKKIRWGVFYLFFPMILVTACVNFVDGVASIFLAVVISILHIIFYIKCKPINVVWPLIIGFAFAWLPQCIIDNINNVSAAFSTAMGVVLIYSFPFTAITMIIGLIITLRTHPPEE